MSSTSFNRAATRLAIVGAGRLGGALARALAVNAALAADHALATEHQLAANGALAADVRDGIELIGPLGRGAAADPSLPQLATCDAVLLCVPDVEIARAAAAIPPGPLVGHCSGATGLEPLAPHEAFSLHPLMTVTAAGADFAGVTAAVDGTSSRAVAMAESLASALQMQAVRIDAQDRAAYHAAASIASNFLVTLEAAAERLAATAGLEREMLVPLVHATVENWASLGGERALTGPVARGDEVTVARQREAIAERTPDLLPLFDALTQATRTLASARELELA